MLNLLICPIRMKINHKLSDFLLLNGLLLPGKLSLTKLSQPRMAIIWRTFHGFSFHSLGQLVWTSHMVSNDVRYVKGLLHCHRDRIKIMNKTTTTQQTVRSSNIYILLVNNQHYFALAHEHPPFLNLFIVKHTQSLPVHIKTHHINMIADSSFDCVFVVIIILFCPLFPHIWRFVSAIGSKEFMIN